jgi:tetratricopeptide (TPR) repeat protein
MEVSRAELVCLHLAAVDAAAPTRSRTLPGVCDAIGGQSGTEGLAVLSTIEELKDEGFVAEARRPVEAADGDRAVYRLTGAGRERAGDLRASLSDERVVVRRQERAHQVRLGDVGDHLGGPSPLVTALVDRDADGVVHVEADRSGERFVDRERALRILEDALWKTEAEPRSVVLEGPTGIGKTELATEFARRVQEGDTPVYEASTERDTGKPYDLFRTLLSVVGAPERSPFDAHRGAAVDADDYDDARQSLFYDVLTHVEEAVEDEQALVVLDNLEWVTPASLDLLEYLLAHLEDTGLRLVCSYNTEFVEEDDRVAAVFDAAAGTGTVERLQLEPLSAADVGDMVRWLLDAEDLPREFVSSLHEHTGGNPLFVTASVRHLEEQRHGEDRVDALPTDVDTLSLPRTAREVIEARLDNLAAEQRRLLETAAVVGERVPLSVLSEVTGRSESSLHDVATVFVDAALWERAGTQELPLTRTFRFGSAVIRETVLDGMSDERLRSLHEAVAEALRSGDVLDEESTHATVAEHYERAGDDDRALEQFRAAGEAASDVYAHEEALESYQRALSLAERLGETTTVAELHERLGDVHTWTGNYEAARTQFEARADLTDDVVTVQRMHRKRSLSSWHQADYEGALSAADAGLELREGPDADDVETCRLLQHRAMVLGARGDAGEALSTYERALALAEELGADGEVAGALRGIGSTRLRMGEVDAAAEPLERAIDVYREVGDRRELVWTLNSMAARQFHAGELAAAADTFRECRDIFEEIGFRGGQAAVLNNLGGVAHHREQPELAIERYREALEIARGLEEDRRRTTLLANLAELHLERGDLETARTDAMRSMGVAREIGATNRTAAALGRLATCRYYGGNLEGARDDLAEALSLVADTGDKSKRAELLYERGRVERALEEPGVAVDTHGQALALAEEHGIDEQVALNRGGLVVAHVDAGDLEAAAEHVQALASREELPRRAQLALARYWRETGDLEAAGALLADGRETVEELGYRTRTVEFDLALARVAQARGDDEHAVELAERALATAEECGLELLVEDAWRVLGGE